MSVEITIKLSLADAAAIQNAGANGPPAAVLQASASAVAEAVEALPFRIAARQPADQVQLAPPQPLPPPAPAQFHVYIREVGTGHTFPLRIDQDTAIDEIKDLIRVTKGIPPNQMRLIHAGKSLENGRFADDYCIKEGSKIDLAPILW